MNRLQQSEDQRMMRRCIELARKGAGHVSPNPMVGAVIVKQGRLLGVGYHRKFGGPHAEVNAIAAARGSVRGATLYVNLEPCNFFGKTPPCTDLIISSKFSRVVIGMKDPNPLVAGKGIQALRRAGIKTTVGILEAECRALNEFFSKYITTRMPFVTLKIAQTLDGKIADEKGHSKWITGKKARTLVHVLRSQYDAVLVGARTVDCDDPRLTVRAVKARNPIRVVLDGQFACKPSAKVFSGSDAAMRIIAVARRYAMDKSRLRKQFAHRDVNVIVLDGDRHGRISIKTLLTKLGEMGISSLFVEGGATVFSGFINAGMADKVITFISPSVMGRGLDPFAYVSDTSDMRLKKIRFERAGVDVIVSGYLH